MKSLNIEQNVSKLVLSYLQYKTTKLDYSFCFGNSRRRQRNNTVKKLEKL